MGSWMDAGSIVMKEQLVDQCGEQRGEAPRVTTVEQPEAASDLELEMFLQVSLGVVLFSCVQGNNGAHRNSGPHASYIPRKL